jgi:alcohol dehydrogenase
VQDTLYPALDALSHALESIWNTNRTDESQGYSTQAINKICESLPQVLEQPKNLVARKNLQRAAALAGLAISQTKTAIAHAISYPLTVKYTVPHGLACSFTLAAIIREEGAKKLNLAPALADKVLSLLQTLTLEQEIIKFVDWQTLISQFEPVVDPSRAGNFVIEINANWLKIIIANSQWPDKNGATYEA